MTRCFDGPHASTATSTAPAPCRRPRWRSTGPPTCCREVTDACVQLYGGYGYTTEYKISELWVDARVNRIYAGTNEIMKELIGRSMGL